MKKLHSLIFALLAIVGYANAAVDSSITGKTVESVGTAATTIETGTWYLLYNQARGCYVSEETNSILMRATGNFTAPVSTDEKAGYMFQFVTTGTDNQYYIKSGNGLYFTINNGSSTVSTEPVAYTIAQIGDNAGHFYGVMVSDGRVLDGNAAGGTLAGWGTTIPTSTGGNNDYQFLPLEIIDFDLAPYNEALTTASNSINILQKTNGAITSETQFYSNKLESTEGSYGALIDENADSYFHSSYNDAGTDPHYLRVDLGENNTLQYFRFYTKKRNANNRPNNITIYGSNDDSEYTEITTINEGLVASDDYLSAKIDLNAEYRYIKFLVNSTNTGTIFFTYAEFYVFDASNETTNGYLENIYSLKNASISDADIESKMTAVATDYESIAFEYYKQQALDATTEYEKSVAAEGATPAVGEFTYEAYTALQTAIANATTAAEIEEALNDFIASQNAPVFVITSEFTGGYSEGKAIYYNGGTNWRWGDLSKFSTKYMWAVPGATTTDIADIAVDEFDAEGTFYAIKDMATETVIRNIPAQIVKITGWDNVYNMQYNAGATNTNAAHHAQNGGALVNWCPATTTDCLASAWSFEYISDAYTIKQYTAQLNAAEALQTAYNANISYKTATFSNALGEYSYTGSINIADAFVAAETILNKSYEEIFAMEVSEIEAATNDITAISGAITLNMPVAGTYLRIKSVDEWEATNTYLSSVNSTSSTTRAAFVAEADASTIFYFDGTQLVSYASGNYLVNNSSFLGYNGVQTAGTKIAFQAASDGLTGAYNILFNDGNRKLYTNKNGYTDAAGSTSSGYGYDFNLEEVTTLPVTITEAGYATFYAPVAVKYTDIEAYYTTGDITDGKYIQMVDFSGTIPANEGAILKGNAGDYELTITNTDASIEGNKLTGSEMTKLITKEDGNSYYILGRDADSNIGLYNPINGDATETFYNAGHKAYMLMEGAAQTIGYSFGFDWGGTTGIENIENAVEENATEAIYDITGRQIKAITTPGIYIINGKKTFVK